MTPDQLDLFYKDARQVLSEYCPSGVVFTPIQEAETLLTPVFKKLNGKAKLRVLEPSSGTGNLIIAVLNILNSKKISPKRVEIVSCELNADYIKLQKQFINKIYPGWEKSIFYACGDFLGNFHDEEQFDVVVMNPPWVGYRGISGKEKAMIKQTFGLTGQFDLLDPFVLKCFQMLKPNGKMALFLPDKVLSSHQPSNSIDRIKNLCSSFQDRTLPSTFFHGVQHESVFINLEKSARPLSLVAEPTVSNEPTVADHFDLFRGFEISGRSSHFLVSDRSHALDPSRAFVSGKEMETDGTLNVSEKRFISKKVPSSLVKAHFDYKGPAILVRKTGSPVRVCYVESLPHVSQVVFVIVPKDSGSRRLLKQLAEYLSSEAGQKQLSANSGKLKRSLFPYITISDIKNIKLSPKMFALAKSKKVA